MFHITAGTKIGFFIAALKKHLALLIFNFILLLVSCGGIYFLFYANDGLNLFEIIVITFFIAMLTLISIVFLYMNISSIRYYYEKEIVKKYGRYRDADIAEMTRETDTKDGVIRCTISVNYAGEKLTDLFELPLDESHLLPKLLAMQKVPIRVVDAMPSLFNIAERKLLKELRAKVQ
ncbi:MAG: hypothetical protein P8Y49_02680 [Sulfurovaceae bacterium]